VTRAAIYARVSTAEQVDGTSLGTQVQRCEHYIAAQDWTPAARYVDEGVSGAKASRPALDQLMTAVRAGTVDVVVIAKLDRIGRSMRHLGALLGELDDRKVALVSVSEAFDSSTASGRLQRNMLGSFAEFERELIRDRMTSGRDARVRSGSWSTAMCPFGFRAGPPDYRLGFLEPEAYTLRRMVDLFVNHKLNTTEVARQLNAEGRPPRRAAKWTTARVRHILQDPDHLGGTFTWRRPSRGLAGPPIPVSGPALLDPTTLQRLKDRVAATSIGHRTHPDRYLLSGRIRGPHGAPMYGHTTSAPVYKCAETFRSVYLDGTPCKVCHTVRVEHVEDLVWAEITALLADTSRRPDLPAARRRPRPRHRRPRRPQPHRPARHRPQPTPTPRRMAGSEHRTPQPHRPAPRARRPRPHKPPHRRPGHQGTRHRPPRRHRHRHRLGTLRHLRRQRLAAQRLDTQPRRRAGPACGTGRLPRVPAAPGAAPPDHRGHRPRSRPRRRTGRRRRRRPAVAVPCRRQRRLSRPADRHTGLHLRSGGNRRRSFPRSRLRSRQAQLPQPRRPRHRPLPKRRRLRRLSRQARLERRRGDLSGEPVDLSLDLPHRAVDSMPTGGLEHPAPHQPQRLDALPHTVVATE